MSKTKHSVETELMNTWMPRACMVVLRRLAHDRKCTVAHIVRQMIGHHISIGNPGGYVGHMPRHDF